MIVNDMVAQDSVDTLMKELADQDIFEQYFGF